MKKKVFHAARMAAAFLVLSTVLGYAQAHFTRPESAAVPLPATNSHGLTNGVILISVDGLRPDAIEAFGAATLGRLMREGSYTLSATTVMPSKTLPSHISMLTGQPPERHGVLWNSNRTSTRGTVGIPTVFGVLRSQGYRTAAFFSKSKLKHLQRAGTLDYSQAPGGWFGRWSAQRTVQDVETYLAKERPNFLFIHLGDVDKAGHSSGWMSDAYGKAVRSSDALVGRILAAAGRAYGDDYTVIVTSDHGGHERDHGSADPRDVTIPWIAWGRGVDAGPIAGRVKTMDSASTVLWLLGALEPADWAGDPVVSAFASTSDE